MARRSAACFLTGIIIFSFIVKSVRQTMFALSSRESEYMAVSLCKREVALIRNLFYELLNDSPYCGKATIYSLSLL